MANPPLEHRWRKGQSGNPSGMPKKLPHQALAEDFSKKILADFKKHGKKAIEAAREKNPVAYLKVIEGMVPKNVQRQVAGKVEYIMIIGDDEVSNKTIDVTPDERKLGPVRRSVEKEPSANA